jgi:hypothetical protein
MVVHKSDFWWQKTRKLRDHAVKKNLVDTKSQQEYKSRIEYVQLYFASLVAFIQKNKEITMV